MAWEKAQEEGKRLGFLKTRVARAGGRQKCNRGGEQQFGHQEGEGGSESETSQEESEIQKRQGEGPLPL